MDERSLGLNDDALDAETLALLGETDEVRIETHRDEAAPRHATTTWVVVVDGAAFVRGGAGRCYREVSANSKAALLVGDRRVPVRAVPETDDGTVATVSEAYRAKYEASYPGPTRAMVRAEALPTTLRLLPA